MSITYKEMKQQYAALTRTFEYMASMRDEIIEFFKKLQYESLTYIGCGSSYCLCESAEMTAKTRLGTPSTAMAAGDLMLNHNKYAKLLERTMIIVFSRSGSTSEVLKALESVNSDGAIPVLSITCLENPPLKKLSDFTLELPWAFDESVCQTRTIVNLYAVNLLIAAYLSGDAGLESSIRDTIQAGESFMNGCETDLAAIASENWLRAVILADGEMKGIASEGVLALTEIAKIPGNCYNLLDVRHGPMVLIDENTLVIACLSKNGYDYQKSLIQDIAARGAKIVTYSDMPFERIGGARLHIASNFEMENPVRGIPFIFIPQAIACYRAKRDGINPDSPEGLSAWVKL